MHDIEKEIFWREMFVLFDKEDKNYLTIDLLKKFLSSVGVLIELKDFYKKQVVFYPEKHRKFTFDMIWQIFKDYKVITDHYIVEAFKDFDKNGKIKKEELKYVMTNLGDKIKDEEAEKLLSKFQIDEKGNLDNEEFLSEYIIET